MISIESEHEMAQIVKRFRGAAVAVILTAALAALSRWLELGYDMASAQSPPPARGEQIRADHGEP